MISKIALTVYSPQIFLSFGSCLYSWVGFSDLEISESYFSSKIPKEDLRGIRITNVQRKKLMFFHDSDHAWSSPRENHWAFTDRDNIFTLTL